MTVTTHHRRAGRERVDDCPAWLDPGGPAARTVFVGREPGIGRAPEVSRVAVPVETRPGAGSQTGAVAVGRTSRVRPIRRGVSGRTARRLRVRSSGAAAVSCEASDPPSLHGATLTRRGRIVVAAAWMVLAAVAAVPIVGAIAAEAEPPASTATVSVVDGDTLWDIARSVDPSADPRETVSAIIDLNDLDSAGDVRAGDRLVVPAGP